MRATTNLPRRCTICRCRIDWTGADHRRAPGSLEDGVVLCRDCCHRIGQRAMLDAYELTEKIGADHLFGTRRELIAAYEALGPAPTKPAAASPAVAQP